MITSNSTLSECKSFLRSKYEKGKAAQCPCCEQLVKVYKRSINKMSAYSLLMLIKMSVSESGIIPVHIQKKFAQKGSVATGLDYIQLKRFGLIEETEERGYYTPSQKGLQFALGKINIPEYAIVYNNKTIRWSENTVSIRDSLKKKFDYDEIMTSNYINTTEKWILADTLKVHKAT